MTAWTVGGLRLPRARSVTALAALVAAACGGGEAGLDGGHAFGDAAAAVDAGGDPASDGGAIADGGVTVDAGDPCTGCHGAGHDPAPPKGLAGEMSSSARGVGAHREHLAGSDWRRAVVCTDCHLVPSALLDPGHIDSARPAELTFGALARADGAHPVWNGTTCSGVYCHGATRTGGSNRSPVWTTVDGSQAACGTCHGVAPPPPHPPVGAGECGPCHPFTGLQPDDPSTHVDGELQVIPCGGCHPVPPSTGAHTLHYADTSDPPLAVYGDLRTVADFALPEDAGYVFGCGQCHPIDPARHIDGTLQVQLSGTAAPVGSLKARNATTASYAGGRCSGVYCHSSGQAAPAYVDSPAWVGGTFAQRCSGCHDNPPAYPSGGAGAADANGHLVLAEDGYEFGHFGGLPGPWHNSRHGTTGAAPITCQTCHYDTTDPDATGPGGLYWLDTTGDYDLGGGLDYECSECHTGAPGAPAVGEGAVRASMHVNGARDVAFDPRTSIPPGVTGLPAPPNRPTYPYWVRAVPGVLPPDSTVNGATWSLHLASSSYDPGAKTCANVPCHLGQSFGTGRPAYEPLRWGLLPVGSPTCNACHQF